MKKNIFNVAISVFIFIFYFASASTAAPSSDSFKKQDISNARFGEGDRERYLKNANQLAAAIRTDVKGQGTAAQILQNRLVQYFENFGNMSNFHHRVSSPT